jgi:AcrR family transcriptional regulator
MTEPTDARAPKQERSAWTRERLLDVLTELLADQTVDEIRLADVAARAGVTVGAIYGRFDGKSEMVIAAYERYSDDAVKRMESWAADPRWAKATPREIVASWVKGGHAFNTRRLPLARLSAGSREPKIIAGEQRIVACSAATLTRLLHPHVPEKRANALERNLAFAVMASRSTVIHRASIPSSGPLGFSDTQLVDALIDLVLGMAGQPVSTQPKQRR